MSLNLNSSDKLKFDGKTGKDWIFHYHIQYLLNVNLRKKSKVSDEQSSPF